MKGAALALTAALALAGCAGASDRVSASGADELAATLAGRVAGAPTDCVNVSAASGSFRAVGGTLLFSDGARLYRSDPVDGCAFLAGDPIVIVEATASRICRNDRFRTVNRGTSIPSPYCRFGAFTPYARPR